MFNRIFNYGSEDDPRAPWNEVIVERECEDDIEVLWSRQCEECECERLVEELRRGLTGNDGVVDLGVLSPEYDDDTLTVYADATIRVNARACGNIIDDPYPEPTEDSVFRATLEQYHDILSAPGWSLERL